EVALGRGVVLENLRDSKALLELAPDLRTQSVAAGYAQRVLCFFFLRRSGEEITTQLADILEQRAALGDYALPESAGREALAQHPRSAPDQRSARRDDAAHAVVHRQAIVHAVFGLHVDETGEPVAPLHEPVVADIRRLRQPGGSRGVDAERTIFQRGRRR